ncbi:DUF6318 family protein [Demequina salsinemoris]|uniref:DUF6318 family protein n=1 Tax=Demequina salsinemoris TaxID=577470 RepID=UPI000783A8ED|nr:DUF6318 family protein [Demequina salsinemoris]
MVGTNRTLGVALAAGALGAVLLTGCTGSDAVVAESASPTETTESASASATPSASPSASPSTTTLSDEELLAMMPEDAARTDVAGAMATAQFFMSEYPNALKSTDPLVLKSLSLDSCDFCADIIGDVEYLSETGQHLAVGSVDQDQSTLQGTLDDDGSAFVRVTVSQSQFDYVDSEGNSAGSSPAGTFTVDTLLTWTDGLWRVQGVSVDDTK